MSQIRPYLKLLLKNWWLIVVLSATGYAAGRIITHRQLDIYAASAEIYWTKAVKHWITKSASQIKQGF